MNLRELRKSKKLSQHDLAVKLGMSQPAVSNLENGKTQFHLGLFEPYMDALEVSKTKLLTAVLKSRDTDNGRDTE